MRVYGSRYQADGAYLLFPDGQELVLTKDIIDKCCSQIFDDEEKLPKKIKTAKDFELCEICPKKDDPTAICHALYPILTFRDALENYHSYDEVTIIYKHNSEQFLVEHTTMQRALTFLSMLSIFHYCEVGKKYWRYYYGTHPLMSSEEIASKIFINMFWHAGSLEKAQEILDEFQQEITTITKCLQNRVELCCQKDSFANSLVLTHLPLQILKGVNIVELIKESFDKHEAANPI